MKMQFVLVYEDGAMRTRLWNPMRGFWEDGEHIGVPVPPEGRMCSNPTHWMELPEEPQ